MSFTSEYHWYERDPKKGGADLLEVERSNIDRSMHSRLSKPSTLFELFQHCGIIKPTRPTRTRKLSAKEISRKNARELANRKQDAKDVLSGKKIAITQEEYDRLLDHE